MIPMAHILEWQEKAPWQQIEQVEQDLIISRVLVELFSDKKISKKLVFRGGTALNKLYLKPQARYSEDIDLVKIDDGVIGPILDSLRKIVDPLLGKPKYKINKNICTLSYRYIPESMVQNNITRKLKIEINTHEKKSFLDIEHKNFQIESQWFSGDAEITIYSIEELLATKLRALYQRKKGRDLFDLYISLQNIKDLEIDKLIQCFNSYITNYENQPITKKEFIKNMDAKIQDPVFLSDILLLIGDSKQYDQNLAYSEIKDNILSKLM